ncbi:hypothetical protein [Bremerella cremea]|uniref:hypothetical protein n=1 Tax=Bremerella cremea TaxID=1031537 RepID=UPI0031E5B34E
MNVIRQLVLLAKWKTQGGMWNDEDNLSDRSPGSLGLLARFGSLVLLLMPTRG